MTLLDKELQRSILGLQVKCSSGCPWVGELRQHERHVSLTCDGDCPLVEVSCTHGCGQVMMRSLLRQHEEETCTKRPVEFQLARLQSRMERMCSDITQAYKAEIEELKTRLHVQTEEMQIMKEKLDELKKDRDQFTTTIPVFSSSVLCILPKLPNGNIPGVSYYPRDRFVKITGSCEEELEARTHLFLAEYEKILPRLLKDKFEVNDHFPLDSLKSFIYSCNKKFSACYISYESKPVPSIELISTNASQFEIVKKSIAEKAKQKIFRMRFPGDMKQTLTLKSGNIKDEQVDVIVLFVGSESPPPLSASTSLSASLFKFASSTEVSISSSLSSSLPSFSVPPAGKALFVKEPKYCAKNVAYISAQSNRGYFGKEGYSLLSDSIKEAILCALKSGAKSIAVPSSRVGSSGLQSNYVIPAVMERVVEVLGGSEVEDENCELNDIRVLIQDDKMDDDQLSSYFKYLALKYHLQ